MIQNALQRTLPIHACQTLPAMSSSSPLNEEIAFPDQEKPNPHQRGSPLIGYSAPRRVNSLAGSSCRNWICSSNRLGQMLVHLLDTTHNRPNNTIATRFTAACSQSVLTTMHSRRTSPDRIEH